MINSNKLQRTWRRTTAKHRISNNFVFKQNGALANRAIYQLLKRWPLRQCIFQDLIFGRVWVSSLGQT